jgi:hypothetical protein
VTPAPPTTRAANGSGRVTAVLSSAPARDESGILTRWMATQSVNLARHIESLRPFAYGEFGTGPAAPSRPHLDAVNRFTGEFRARLTDGGAWFDAAIAQARKDPSDANIERVLSRKDAVSRRVLYVEGIWDFYFDLFVQRLSAFGERLRAVDRIGANCYEDLYLGLGTARPTPTLLPFSYANSGFGPLTYRRGVPLPRLRNHPNLFPLVVLPQHRLDAVWALSSVLHETAHNLQADLGLWDVLPKMIFTRLTGDGRLPPQVATIWARWHKEIAADLFALVLGGPAAVESLMDVVGRSRPATMKFVAAGVHPTPVLRVPINLALLRRLGFKRLAGDLGAAWKLLYPLVTPRDVPESLLGTFDRAAELTVDVIAFTQHPQLAGKSLVQLVEFGPGQQALVDQAAALLASGQDVGTVPPRLMISAARRALDLRLATPQAITDSFYRSLGRR